MSESEEHRALVRAAEEMLGAVYPSASIVVDIQSAPGAHLPPTIAGFRPDLLVRGEVPKAIAEAKTDGDLDRDHTYQQLTSFVTYLEGLAGGLLVLSVAGRCADRAKTVLRFIHFELGPLRTRVAVFDQCDLWLLQPDRVTWCIYSAGGGA